jgi:antitoxin (DNA-binding transcriptional repressor) of toxin-antitoxin stability system
MKQVGIAELKSHLSRYLRAVRSGQSIAVMDRDTLVAHIVPVCTPAKLRLRKPAIGAPPLNRVPIPKPLRINVDVVELLLEERQRHR